jgi:hypothetical protein
VFAFRACEEIAVVQAFRPALSGGPEGPHYIRSDFFTASSGGPSEVRLTTSAKATVVRRPASAKATAVRRSFSEGGSAASSQSRAKVEAGHYVPASAL